MSDLNATSFLASRVAKAKAKARAATSHQVAHSPKPTQTATAPQLPNPVTTKAVTTSKPQPSGQKQRLATGVKKSDRAVSFSAPIAPEIGLSDTDRQRVVQLFRVHGRNSAAIDLLEPDLPGVWGAIVNGAKIRGPAGHQDRMTLFRIMELPWTPTAGMRSENGNQMDALADRFVRAVSRIESRLSGRIPVTRDAELVVDAMPEAAPSE